LAWLAGQNDLLELFRDGEDVYKFMASAIFKAPPEEITSEQRFIGKMVVLGCGYGMGAVKFQEQLRAKGFRVDSDRCSHIIRQYRLHNAAISRWWIHLNSVVENMLQNKPVQVDARGVMETTPFTGIALPNGLFLNYPELRKEGAEFSYKTRAGRSKIYGGKIAENVCQAIARIIIGEQMLEINKKYRVVLTVHDAVACVVLEGEALEASTYIKTCMRTPPAWALGLPLNCELGVARTYGDC
jgi:DNA polymerase